MTDMIERVAREICRADGRDPDASFAGGLHEWYFYQEVAITAIKAMREPTDEMVSAAKVYRFSDDKYAFQAMIDAALGEEA